MPEQPALQVRLLHPQPTPQPETESRGPEEEEERAHTHSTLLQSESQGTSGRFHLGSRVI